MYCVQAAYVVAVVGGRKPVKGSSGVSELAFLMCYFCGCVIRRFVVSLW